MFAGVFMLDDTEDVMMDLSYAEITGIAANQ